MRKTSCDRRKIYPRGREFGYGDVGEIGGDKKPFSRGEKTLLCKGGEETFERGWGELRDRGCGGLCGRREGAYEGGEEAFEIEDERS